MKSSVQNFVIVSLKVRLRYVPRLQWDYDQRYRSQSSGFTNAYSLVVAVFSIEYTECSDGANSTTVYT